MKLSYHILSLSVMALAGGWASAQIAPSASDTVDIVVNYRLNEFAIDSLFADNASALDALQSLIANPHSQILAITVSGSASPEGKRYANRTLAGKRAESLKEKIIAYGAGPSLISLGENTYVYPSASRADYPRLRNASALISVSFTPDSIPLPAQTIVDSQTTNAVGSIDSAVDYADSLDSAVDYAEEAIFGPESDGMPAAATPHDIPLLLRANLLRWATLTPDLGIEWRINPQWAVLVNGSYTSWSWDSKNRRYALWEVAPEIRCYPGGKRNWYVGAMYKVGSFNYKLSGAGKQGDIMGGGITGGYMLTLNKRLDIDFGLGLGYIHAGYEHYDVIDNVRVRHGNDSGNWFGPVSAGISLVWKPF